MIDVRCGCGGHRERFLGPGQLRVECVRVVHERVIAVFCRHDRLAERVDVGEPIGEACGVVEVYQLRRPRFPGLVIEDVHGLSAGAEVDPVTANLDVVFGIGRVVGEFLAGSVDQILHQAAGKTQASAVGENRAFRDCGFDDVRGRLSDPDLLEHIQRRGMDALQVALG